MCARLPASELHLHKETVHPGVSETLLHSLTLSLLRGPSQGTAAPPPDLEAEVGPQRERALLKARLPGAGREPRGRQLTLRETPRPHS